MENEGLAEKAWRDFENVLAEFKSVVMYCALNEGAGFLVEELCLTEAVRAYAKAYAKEARDES